MKIRPGESDGAASPAPATRPSSSATRYSRSGWRAHRSAIESAVIGSRGVIAFQTAAKPARSAALPTGRIT